MKIPDTLCWSLNAGYLFFVTGCWLYLLSGLAELVEVLPTGQLNSANTFSPFYNLTILILAGVKAQLIEVDITCNIVNS